MTLLLAVLALSYVGSMLMRGRALRGYGLPSGSEWVLFGIALGPLVFGSVDSGIVRAFEPIAAMAVAWLSFVGGAGFVRAVRRAGFRASVLGILMALLCFLAVTLVVYALGSFLLSLTGDDLLALSLGAGAVSAATTRYAIGWVVERYAAHGPLSERVAGLAAADDVVPLLLMAVPFALFAPSEPYQITWWGWALLTLALGGLLGITSAMLLRYEASAERVVGVLLGAALLGTGIAWRLGLSALTAMFALGITLSLLSRRREELGRLLGRAEHIVFLPTMLLAGASLHLHPTWQVGVVLGAACALRALVRCLLAPLVSHVVESGQRPGPLLGLGLLPAGGLTISVGLAFSLRFPGTVGELVLGTAVAQTLLGELLGPVALRIALLQAGEITSPDEPVAEPAVEAAA